MKKLVAIFFFICLLLVVSGCSSVNPAVRDEANVKFDSDSVKSLSAVVGSLETDKYYWYYASKKCDEGGTKGETASYDETGAVEVKAGKGLDKELTGFSIGNWQFKLYAYEEKPDDKERADYAYYGESDVVKLSGGVHTVVSLLVEAVDPDGYGTVLFSGISAEGMSGGTIKYKIDDEGYSTTALYDVASGNHTAYAAYFCGSEKTVESKIVISVLKDVTTVVSGSINDMTTSSSFEVGSYCVAYSSNDADSGTAPFDYTFYPSGSSVTVLDNTGSMTRGGYEFAGWNTKPDGSGEDIAVGGNITIDNSSVMLYPLWQAIPDIMRVGGTVFLVYGNNDGTYRFFMKDGRELNEHTEAGLAEAYYYTVSGKTGADKFYVCDTNEGSGVADGMEWGAYNKKVLEYSEEQTSQIGYGKLNSGVCKSDGNCLRADIPGNTTIWVWLNALNANNTGGNNDWFIGSHDELIALYNSSIGSIISRKDIWSSTEVSAVSAYLYNPDGSPVWSGFYKNGTESVVAIRAF